MLDVARFAVEQDIVPVWLISCAVGGLVFVVIGPGPRASRCLEPSLGRSSGSSPSTSNIDLLAEGAVLGATVGTFVAGSFGLAWKPSASVMVLRSIGWVIVVIGAVSVVAGSVWSGRPCHPPGRRPCLPHVDGGSLALFAIDAAWVAALCFIQAARSRSSVDVARSTVDARLY